MPQDSKAITVEQAIDNGRLSPFQYRVLVLGALAFVAEGACSQALGLAIPSLIRDWGVDRGAFASIAALTLVGFAIGAVAGGWVGDRIGRRNVLVVSLLALALATTGCALTENTLQISIMRVFVGLGLGGTLPNATAVIAEITPARYRSTALAVCIAFLPIGGFLAGEYAAFVIPAFGWRAVFLGDGGLALLFTLLVALFLPESPRYLATQPNRVERLHAVMKRMGHDIARGFAPAATPKHAQPIRAIVAPGFRLDTAALWISFFFVMMSMYTMFSWMPTALDGEGLSAVLASRAISAISLGGLFGGLASGLMTQRFGSRISLTVLAIGAIGAALALTRIVDGSATATLPLITALAILGGGISGSQTALYAVASHVYPPTMRSTGTGVAIGWGRLGAILSSFTGVGALTSGGVSLYLGSIALIVFAAWAAALMAPHQLVPIRRGGSDGKPESLIGETAQGAGAETG